MPYVGSIKLLGCMTGLREAVREDGEGLGSGQMSGWDPVQENMQGELEMCRIALNEVRG